MPCVNFETLFYFFTTKGIYDELEFRSKDVFSASPVIPVMVIKKLEDALPMAKALQAGGINVFEITLRSAVALDAINY